MKPNTSKSIDDYAAQAFQIYMHSRTSYSQKMQEEDKDQILWDSVKQVIGHDREWISKEAADVYFELVYNQTEKQLNQIGVFI